MPSATPVVGRLCVAGAQKVKEVEVRNFPNLPAVQDVNVTNPAGSARFQLVGFTAPVYDGNLGGPLGASQKCQDEGFEGSRMCTTLEVIVTVDIPQGLVGTAWVRPVPVGEGTTVRDISGAGSIASCDFWTTSLSNYQGLVVTAEGKPTLANCGILRSIACCAPVP